MATLLLTTASQVADYVPAIGASLSDELVAQPLRTAQRKYVLPVLGQAMLTRVLAHIDSPESGNNGTNMSALLELCREVLANGAGVEALPFLTVEVSDAGVQITQTETKRPAYQWQMGDLRNALLGAAMEATEAVYACMEDNPSFFPEWLSSTACSIYNNTLIRNATEFNQYYPIGGNRLTFLDLKPAMVRAQDLIIKHEIGEDFIDELLAVLADPSSGSSATTPEDEAIVKLQKALAHLTIAEAKDLKFRYVNGGVITTRMDGNASTKENAQGDAFPDSGSIRTQARITGMEYLAKAHRWLDENSDDFQTYASGPGFRADVDAEPDLDDRMHNEGGIVAV